MSDLQIKLPDNYKPKKLHPNPLVQTNESEKPTKR